MGDTAPGAKSLSDVIALQSLTAGAVALLFLTPIGYPLRIFATFTHEMSHLLATVFSGGEVHAIMVNSNGSGCVYETGAAWWLVAPAGYVGTAVVASLLLFAGARPERQRTALFIICLTLTGYAGAAAASFRVLFALGTILAWVGMVLIKGWELLSGATVRVLAQATALHGVFDVLALLSDYNGRRVQPLWVSPVLPPEPHGFYTDATLMGYFYGGSEGQWAVIWLIISITTLVLGIVFSARSELSAEQTATASRVPPALRFFKKGEGEYSIR